MDLGTYLYMWICIEGGLHIFPRDFLLRFSPRDYSVSVFNVGERLDINTTQNEQNMIIVNCTLFSLSWILIAVRKKSFHKFLVESCSNSLSSYPKSLPLFPVPSFANCKKNNLAFQFFEKTQPGKKAASYQVITYLFHVYFISLSFLPLGRCSY